MQLDRINRAGLTSAQKLYIVKNFLLPRFQDQLQSAIVTKKVLKAADTIIRVSVRKFLGLNRSCADAYLHAPVKSGGLGVTCLARQVPAIMKRRLNNLINDASPTTAAVLSLPYSVRLYDKLLNWTHDNGGSSSIIARMMAEKLENGYSGNGLHQGDCSTESGSWINNPPPYWSGSDYKKAVQLRGNLLPTKGIPSNPPHERKCRMGCNRNESLSHVLQKCPAAHWQRIRRHDQLVTHARKIAEKKGWVVEEEPHIRCTDGALRKPDLVLQMGCRVIVCDVAVSWEGPSSLSLAALNKRAIYSEPRFLSAMASRYPGKHIVVAPLIVGARGIWCRDNVMISSILSFSKQDIRSFITKTIIGSISIHRYFMAQS